MHGWVAIPHLGSFFGFSIPTRGISRRALRVLSRYNCLVACWVVRIIFCWMVVQIFYPPRWDGRPTSHNTGSGSTGIPGTRFLWFSLHDGFIRLLWFALISAMCTTPFIIPFKFTFLINIPIIIHDTSLCKLLSTHFIQTNQSLHRHDV